MVITKSMLDVFDAAVSAQNEYWNALNALEDALDVDIDGTQDLSATDVETLLRSGGA